jgi:hypothetical protein
MKGLFFDWFPFFIAEVHVVSTDHSDLFVLQQVNIPGMRQDSRDIGGDVVFTVSQADDQRAVFPCGNQFLRIAPADNSQCIGTVQSSQGVPYRLQQITFIVMIDKMSDAFCIGIGHKMIPLVCQPFPQMKVIFNNAVVDNSNIARLIRLRMGIDIRWLTMGSPTGMPYPDRAGDWMFSYSFLQIFQPALGFHDVQDAMVVDSYSSRVIAPVFQFSEPIKKNGGCFFYTDVSYDPAQID